MISLRYVPAICVVFAIALAPTLIHSYAGAVVTDTRTTAAVGPALAGFTSASTARDAAWGRERFESFDWFERRYRAGTDEVQLAVIRSYDLKRLYHHPELAVAYGESFLRHETRRLSTHPDVPVHVLHSDVEGGTLAMYVLHYDGRFIDDPVMFQIRTAWELLFKGRKSMTLFFARDISAPRAADLETLGVTRLLFAAVQQFESGP